MLTSETSKQSLRDHLRYRYPAYSDDELQSTYNNLMQLAAHIVDSTNVRDESPSATLPLTETASGFTIKK